jgi:Type I restriction enzyme R protein N terminus (HSDR_N)
MFCHVGIALSNLQRSLSHRVSFLSLGLILCGNFRESFGRIKKKSKGMVMASVTTKVASRIGDGLKKFQPILSSAKAKDVNESNTVVIVTDLLSEIFGFDKYSEITTEHAIKSTYCDLAVMIDGSVKVLIEVKAIGLDLKEPHIKQAIDYAANKGIEWVILTNGVNWKIFKVTFAKPIGQELVVELDLLALSHKNSAHIESLFLASREGIQKYALDEYYTQKQATNKFILGNLILSEDILNAIRRELRQIYPEIKVQIDEIKDALEKDVLKRDVVEGEEAEKAKKKIQRADKRQQKEKLKADPKRETSETIEAQ